MSVGLLAESSPLLGQCVVAFGEVGGSLLEQRQQTAASGRKKYVSYRAGSQLCASCPIFDATNQQILYFFTNVTQE